MLDIIRKHNDKVVGSDCILSGTEYLATRHRTLSLSGAIRSAWAGGGSPFSNVDPDANIEAITNLMLMMVAQGDEPIKLLVDSPGGDIQAGLIFCDFMRNLPVPVYTIGLTAYSMGAVVLACGEKGHRYMFPHGRAMIHQPSISLDRNTPISEADNYVRNARRVETILVDLLMECGVTKTTEELRKDLQADFWMDAQETISYGLADNIATSSSFFLC